MFSYIITHPVDIELILVITDNRTNVCFDTKTLQTRIIITKTSTMNFSDMDINLNISFERIVIQCTLFDLDTLRQHSYAHNTYIKQQIYIIYIQNLSLSYSSIVQI